VQVRIKRIVRRIAFSPTERSRTYLVGPSSYASRTERNEEKFRRLLRANVKELVAFFSAPAGSTCESASRSRLHAQSVSTPIQSFSFLGNQAEKGTINHRLSTASVDIRNQARRSPRQARLVSPTSAGDWWGV